MCFKKNLFFAFLLLTIFSCKNPYFTDPKFKITDIKLKYFPVDEQLINYISPFGQNNYGNKVVLHNGIDIGIKSYSAPFYSCDDGVVSSVDYNTGVGLPGTNYRIIIQISSKLVIEYHFEIGGSVPESERKNNIFVKTGDFVKGGQKIANLLSLSDGAHVHFGIRYENKSETCPLNFFKDDIAKKFEEIFDSPLIEKRPVTRQNICE